MKKRLYILAPNDRFNYGDLLFPYILRHYFSNYFDDIKFVSTTKSDLSEKGGMPTEDYSTLFEVDKDWENHLIVAGGESLCVRWLIILSFVNKRVYYIGKLASKTSRFLGKYSFEIFSNIVDYLFKTKTYYVFSVGKNEMPHFKTIAYNALGGSWLLRKKKFDRKTIDILSSVDYFSVRDGDTSNALKKNGIKHFICPDTAIMMSEVFSEEYLLKKLSIQPQQFDEKYIFFQGNYHLWKNVEELAVQQLVELQSKTKSKLCFCPIGTAFGHSDHIALQNIYGKIKKVADVVLIENPNIFDIMWLIKHAQIYIGSSLHGAITAMSFGVPFVGYGPRKLGAYIDQWTSTYEICFCNKDHIFNKAIEVMQSDTRLNAEEQKKLVKNAFHQLSQLYM